MTGILKLPTQPCGVHHIAGGLLERRVSVALAGAGGNGSQMLSGLARLHRAMLALGHPGGLHVTTYDPDRVSESNVGRQLFYPSDIGQPKAFVLTHRLNMAYGLDWKAECGTFPPTGGQTPRDLLISCVDTAKARRDIWRFCEESQSIAPRYWLDLGNRRRDGQVVLGQTPGNATIAREVRALPNITPEDALTLLNQKTAALLPTVVQVFPDLLDESIAEDDTPSCSLAEALERQDLFVNQGVATWALHLLWRLFREGKIEHHGYFVNLDTGRVNPLPVPTATAKKAETSAKKSSARRRAA